MTAGRGRCLPWPREPMTARGALYRPRPQNVTGLSHTGERLVESTSRMPTRSSLFVTPALALLCHCPQGNSPAGDGNSPRSGKGKLTIKGSDTMVILGQRWAESYAKIEPAS